MVNGGVYDPFYRYQVPAIEAKYLGPRTELLNLPRIAAALKRHPLQLLQYFKYELNVGTNAKNSRYILNGHFSLGELTACIETFTVRFVKCFTCGLPETKFIMSKRNLFLMCAACGNRTEVRQNHKLVTFIRRSGL